ncbi:arrestin domain-containing protein 3-like [Elysia marginata]|uniref:Arrestin domain-containing protein 3-like n=1 Tax=Elysia marginata TaxID=1093978 RepID=A0AAV4G186_9GAST|nr:arrestin domain-containing protein 3-like [Elysia marginata]
MGKITQCSIALKNNNTAVYRPGDTIEGYVILDVEGEVRINAVNIFLAGKALTKWDSPRNSFESIHRRETYVDVFKRLVREDVGVLTAGRHRYTFSFKLPSQGLPSSFEGEYGAVRYWLRVQVDKKFPGIDAVFYKYFTVLSNVNVNDPERGKTVWYKNTKTMSKVLGFGDAGTVTLKACTHRQAYCPGEKIEISLEAKNESLKDCGIVKATLCQEVEFQAGGDPKRSSTEISIVEGSPLEAGKTLVWDKQGMLVRSMPPSTAQLTCQIIKVSYHVRVEIEVSMGFNLRADLPVTIGTVPFGASPPQQGTEMVSNTVNLSYMACQYGIKRFNRSEGDFKYVEFKPNTVWVFHDISAQSGATSLAAAQQTMLKTLHAQDPHEGRAVSSDPPPSSKTASANAGNLSPLTSTVVPEVPEKQALPTSIVNPEAQEKLPLSAPEVVQRMPDSITAVVDCPPSYEEIMAMGTHPQSCTPSLDNGLVPYHLAENSGAGCVLLLAFPVISRGLVQASFKRSAANMSLHRGQVLGYAEQFPVIPASPDTSAVLLYFPSQRASLSWLQNQTTAFPDLASTWLALVTENTEFKSVSGRELPSPPTPQSAAGIIAFTYAKINWPAGGQKDKAEASEMAKRARELGNKVKHRRVLHSSKVLFAWGDWSSFPLSESDSCVVIVRQFENLEVYESHRCLISEDPLAKGLFEKIFQPIVRQALSTKDLALFKN